ncbi:hypothetical protein SAMN02745229_01451 [Butyrivibrio fibrisolvens DSM 3071]|uniref:DUF4282 domain-containing protein n=1 Tax=Butyrivibrio fibrisolvens DSM 3071 TaxID=1121131 RepID=A0A1M5YFQ2_BUTFI|nr:hypothetical protein [Butyrivibrio fibrisolvens]SHI10877.1 hypothetical protein SAMN02745229_01451 [Butyrivibrio fibrisolvens DSM 3071]
MDINTAMIIGAVIALVVTILICAIILPVNKEGQFTGFLKTIRDYFLMRYLIVELIVRFLFVFATTACIFIGFFIMFTENGFESNFLPGILTIIIGPIICRIIYELLMVAILQLRNIIEINNKIPGQITADIYKVPAPTPIGQPAQKPVQPSVNPGAKFDPATGQPLEQTQQSQDSQNP